MFEKMDTNQELDINIQQQPEDPLTLFKDKDQQLLSFFQNLLLTLTFVQRKTLEMYLEISK